MPSGPTFSGRHYETGTIVDALAALGAIDPFTTKPYDESLALGASGGIAFGYFVFEYAGNLPHVAILTRNTFSPFERTLDNLAVRRELRETVKPEKGRENLVRELDFGHPVIAWADVFSLSHTGFEPQDCYGSRPYLVVGHDAESYQVVRKGSVIDIPIEEFEKARGRLKKDRFRIMTLEVPDEARLADGLISGIATCCALYLDKPPAGAAHNFGIAGMAYWAKMLWERRNALAWRRKFEPGPRLLQALAGSFLQPGVWDWIETWGTLPGADRSTYGSFLRQAAVRLQKPNLIEIAEQFELAAPLWSRLAETAMPDSVPEFAELKKWKVSEDRIAARTAIKPLLETASDKLAPIADDLFESMAFQIDAIAAIEREAVLSLRRA